MARCGDQTASVPAADERKRPHHPGTAALALAAQMWPGRNPRVCRRNSWIYDVEIEKEAEEGNR